MLLHLCLTSASHYQPHCTTPKTIWIGKDLISWFTFIATSVLYCIFASHTNFECEKWHACAPDTIQKRLKQGIWLRQNGSDSRHYRWHLTTHCGHFPPFLLTDFYHTLSVMQSSGCLQKNATLLHNAQHISKMQRNSDISVLLFLGHTMDI